MYQFLFVKVFKSKRSATYCLWLKIGNSGLDCWTHIFANYYDDGQGYYLLKIGIGEWILIADVKSKALRQKFKKIQKT